jgi:hypothetical protein
MNKDVHGKTCAFAIMVLFVGMSFFSTVNSFVLRKNVFTDSLEQLFTQNNCCITKDVSTGKPDGIAPLVVNNNQPQHSSANGDRENFAYGCRVSPSPIGLINISSWEFLGPDIIITGADIDNNGHWYGIGYDGGLYLLGFDGNISFIGNSLPMDGLCFDSTTQTWYGSGDHNLYTIDITTGAATLIGPDGITNTIIGLACDNEGNIYGYDVVSSGMSTLYLFNKANGSATVIGSMGIGFMYAQDPAYDRDNDILYIAGYTQAGMGGLYTCDVYTGAVTFLGPFPNNAEVDGFVITWTPGNQPPQTPIISGPTDGIVDVNYTFSIGPITDPEGDSMFCMWDWGDGNITEWTGPYTSGQTIYATHKWTQSGIYDVGAKLKDTYGAESGWSASYTITIHWSGPPIKPIIDGPHVGRVGTVYNFTVVITDPEGNQFFFQWDWGDGNFSEWLGPYNAGEMVAASHAWNAPGTYIIKVKAKDIHGIESESDPFDIQIVELKKSFLVGSFNNQSETEDLRIISTNFLIIVPSDTIIHARETIVIAKTYRLGFFLSSLFVGIFEAAILAETPRGTDHFFHRFNLNINHNTR